MEEPLSLKTIASWQLNDTSEVKLPSMQRGFVWKPAKIEALWDSLLRKFPIGSFLFSKSGDDYLLMDGQQRATSIALGFFNPFSGKMNPWSIKEPSAASKTAEEDAIGHLPVVWIDIKPSKKPSRHQYLIRVVTRSHPWGYQSINPDTRLDVADRKKALEILKKDKRNEGKEKYTQFSNKTYFPFDASYPLPLCFFFEAAETNNSNAKEAADAVTAMCEEHIPKHITVKAQSFKEKIKDRESFIDMLRGDLRDDLEEICRRVIEINENTKIKYDVLDEDVLYAEDNIGDDGTEDPTLFVRINSGGIELGGDELIYSIYKAMFPKSKDLVEKIGMNYIPPTQIISIASRIALSDVDSVFHPKMNVPTFQSNINRKRFKKKLTELIGDDERQGLLKVPFEKAVDILSLNGALKGLDASDETGKRMPPVIVKLFIKDFPDLFLLLIYWLKQNDSVELSNDEKKSIVARLLVLSWFTFDKTKKAVEKTVKEMWPDAKERDFFEKPLKDYFLLTNDKGNEKNPLLTPPIPPDLLKKYYSCKTVKNHFLNDKGDQWDLLSSNEGKEINRVLGQINKKGNDDWKNKVFKNAINSIWDCRPMVLLAQREYINTCFKDFNQLEDLDDTNAPWDWDHIYPDSWVYNAKKLPPIIKSWNDCIGNLRALDLEKNRSLQDKSPFKRLSDYENEGIIINDRRISFVFEQDDDVYSDDWSYWQKIINREIQKGPKKDILNHYYAVVTRMLNIYRRWWNDFEIGKVIGYKK
jgi:hypothetical protein